MAGNRNAIVAALLQRANREGVPVISPTELPALFRHPDYSGNCQAMHISRRIT
jgi:hypothetical protein